MNNQNKQAGHYSLSPVSFQQFEVWADSLGITTEELAYDLIRSNGCVVEGGEITELKINLETTPFKRLVLLDGVNLRKLTIFVEQLYYLDEDESEMYDMPELVLSKPMESLRVLSLLSVNMNSSKGLALEFFPNLETLLANNCKLEELDLRPLAHLRHLDIRDNGFNMPLHPQLNANLEESNYTLIC